MEPVIYKIQNKLNNKCYIGKSINVHRRWQEHRHNALNTTKRHPLYDSIRKYGIDNFTFEVILYTSAECIDKDEMRLIKEYNSINAGYNLTEGGGGGDTFSNRDEVSQNITRERISKKSKIANSKNRALHSENTKKLWVDDTYRKKVIDGLKNTWSNPDKKERHSEKMKSICNTPEMKQLRSKNSSGKNNSNYKGKISLYLDNKLVKEYDFLKDAISDTGLSIKNITTSIREGTVINRVKGNTDYNGYQFIRNAK